LSRDQKCIGAVHVLNCNASCISGRGPQGCRTLPIIEKQAAGGASKIAGVPEQLAPK
jgi:hypothetical protein